MTQRWPAAGLTRGGVLLRRWHPDDLDGYAAQYDDEARRWSPPQNLSPDRLRARFDALLAASDEPLTHWAIADPAAPHRVLGGIDVRPGPPPPFSVCDVGYTVLAAARGRGVASTALALLADWLLDADGGGLLRVQLDHAVENLASCRTALRAGFPVEGRRPCYLPLKAGPEAPVVHHDVCLHGRVRG